VHDTEIEVTMQTIRNRSMNREKTV